MSPSSSNLIFFILLRLASYVHGQECTGPPVLNLTITKQYITTPNYDNGTYPPNLNCSYVINAPDTWRIILEIERLQFENQIFSECVDSVAFYEGNHAIDSQLIGKYCELSGRRTLISNSTTMLVVIETDDMFEFEGVLISARAVSPVDCPPGWGDTEQGSCVKLETHEKEDFIGAQERCREQQSNLLEIRSTPMYNLYQKWYDKIRQPIWLGYHDASVEKSVMTLDGETGALFPLAENTNLLTGNTDQNDCIAAQFFEHLPFIAEPCYQRYAYACEMARNWSTPARNTPVQDIHNGIYASQNEYSLWLIIFMLCILLILALFALCCACNQKRENSRVHAIEAGNHNTAASNLPADNPAPSTTPQPGPSTSPKPTQPKTIVMNNSSSSRGPTVDVRPVETVQVNPQEVEQALTPLEETPIVHTITATNVPTLPLRESTFHSLSREDMTLRTRRPQDPFDRPRMQVLDTVSAISLDEFWSNRK